MPEMTSLVMVELTASDCHSCQKIHPILQQLRERYHDRVTFITFNLSTHSATQIAIAASRDFKGQNLIERYQDEPGTVLLIQATTGQPMGLLQDNLDPHAYRALLDKALEKQHAT